MYLDSVADEEDQLQRNGSYLTFSLPLLMLPHSTTDYVQEEAQGVAWAVSPASQAKTACPKVTS